MEREEAVSREDGILKKLGRTRPVKDSADVKGSADPRKKRETKSHPQPEQSQARQANVRRGCRERHSNGRSKLTGRGGACVCVAFRGSTQQTLSSLPTLAADDDL